MNKAFKEELLLDSQLEKQIAEKEQPSLLALRTNDTVKLPKAMKIHPSLYLWLSTVSKKRTVLLGLFWQLWQLLYN
jgi:hypothetical protein